jgi:hypothetical protein
MNSTTERVFLNILVEKFKKYSIEDLTEVPHNCVKVVYNLKYNKCVITIPEYIVPDKVPEEILYMKKFIRKISYTVATKIFSITPVRDDFCKIYIKK